MPTPLRGMNFEWNRHSCLYELISPQTAAPHWHPEAIFLTWRLFGSAIFRKSHAVFAETCGFSSKYRAKAAGLPQSRRQPVTYIFIDAGKRLKSTGSWIGRGDS